MPYGRILKIFLNKLKKQTFLRILIFYAVDAPTAILGSLPRLMRSRSGFQNILIRTPPRKGGGCNYFYSRSVTSLHFFLAAKRYNLGPPNIGGRQGSETRGDQISPPGENFITFQHRIFSQLPPPSRAFS